MSNKLRDIFRPELKLIDKNITKSCPCNTCLVNEDYHNRAIYGSIAERQYMETPEECNQCLKRTTWDIDCHTKLRWYENNDERLKNLGEESLKKYEIFPGGIFR